MVKKTYDEVKAAVEEVQKEKAEKRAKEEAEKKVEEKPQTPEEKNAELINDIKRLQAEFENYKKRSEKEVSRSCEFEKVRVLKRTLPILDSFELAFINTDNHEDFVKGIELIFSQFHSFLKEQGVEKINTEGRKADPYLDDVMLTEKTDKEDGTITEELQKGYKCGEMILRHSKVKVSRG